MKRVRTHITRLIALALCLMLGTAFIGYAEDENSFIDFDATLTNGFEQSASSWFSSPLYRALLTLTLIMDVDNALDIDLYTAITNNSYVGREGLFLVVGIILDDGTMLINYSPLTGDAAYMYSKTDLSTTLKEMLIESVLENGCSDGYYKNSSDDMYKVIETIVGAGD